MELLRDSFTISGLARVPGMAFDSHLRKIAGFLRGVESNGNRNFGCVHFPFFTLRVLAMSGMALVIVGVILARLGRIALYQLVERLTDCQFDKHNKAIVNHQMPAVISQRKELTRRYNFVERRRLETAINGGMVKIYGTRGGKTYCDDILSRGRRMFSGIWGRGDDIDEEGEEVLSILRERLSAVRSERYHLKRQYTRYLDELTENKKRLETCRKKFNNTRTEKDVVKVDSTHDLTVEGVSKNVIETNNQFSVNEGGDNFAGTED